MIVLITPSMGNDSTIHIGNVPVTKTSIGLVAGIMLLSLYPFIMEVAGPMDFFLGLPAWYWVSTVILAVIYVLSVYLVLHGQSEEDKAAAQSEELSEVTNHG